jgi:hypothetical protein
MLQIALLPDTTTSVISSQEERMEKPKKRIPVLVVSLTQFSNTALRTIGLRKHDF